MENGDRDEVLRNSAVGSRELANGADERARAVCGGREH